jgi:hypothetical protein
MTPNTNPSHTIQEIATATGYSMSHVCRLVKQGALPGVKVEAPHAPNGYHCRVMMPMDAIKTIVKESSKRRPRTRAADRRIIDPAFLAKQDLWTIAQLMEKTKYGHGQIHHFIQTLPAESRFLLNRNTVAITRAAAAQFVATVNEKQQKRLAEAKKPVVAGTADVTPRDGASMRVELLLELQRTHRDQLKHLQQQVSNLEAMVADLVEMWKTA